MFRPLIALLVILLAAPACAGTRLGGFHGGLPAFHPGGRPVLGLFGGYFCGYNCGWGFYNPAYCYFNNYGYGYSYGSSYGNSYFNGYGYFNRDGYFDRYGYGNGDGYGNGYGTNRQNAVRISDGLTGGYVPDPVGADIPALTIPKSCWVRRPAYDPSGANFGQVLVNLCHRPDSVTVTGSKDRSKAPTPWISQSGPDQRKP